MNAARVVFAVTTVVAMTYQFASLRTTLATFNGGPTPASADRYGPLVGRIVTNERYAAALEKGSPLRAGVNGALNALSKDGTIARLRQRWLGRGHSQSAGPAVSVGLAMLNGGGGFDFSEVPLNRARGCSGASPLRPIAALFPRS